MNDLGAPTSPDLQIDALDPDHLPLSVDYHPRVHAVLEKIAHSLLWGEVLVAKEARAPIMWAETWP